MSVLPAQEALVQLMITSCVADRSMTHVEMRTIETLVDQLPVFAGFDESRLPDIAEEVGHFLERTEGLDELLTVLKSSLPTKLYETAYALAVEVVAADVVAVQEELRFLEMLRDALDLDPLVTAAIERSARVRYRRL